MAWAYKPGNKVRAKTPTICGWQGVGIVLDANFQNAGIVNVVMMDGKYVGKTAQFLPTELEPA